MNTHNVASLSDFEKFRHQRNVELERRFSRIFDGLIGKYATLHKHVMYKKINKVSFINKQTNNNSILSVLNKLTNSNANSLSDKIMARCNQSNVSDLVRQTLDYASSSTINASILETLLVGFIREYPGNDGIRYEIQQYVVRFLENFDLYQSTKQDENYEDFLDRTVSNNRVKGAAKMVTSICLSEQLRLIYDGTITRVFVQLVNKIDKILNTEADDNSKSLLIECLLILLQDVRGHSQIEEGLTHFKGCEFESRVKSVSNKHRFQMYDVFETVEKIEKKNAIVKKVNSSE